MCVWIWIWFFCFLALALASSNLVVLVVFDWGLLCWGCPVLCRVARSVLCAVCYVAMCSIVLWFCVVVVALGRGLTYIFILSWVRVCIIFIPAVLGCLTSMQSNWRWWAGRNFLISKKRLKKNENDHAIILMENSFKEHERKLVMKDVTRTKQFNEQTGKK
jgi:hypothetical protein